MLATIQQFALTGIAKRRRISVDMDGEPVHGARDSQHGAVDILSSVQAIPIQANDGIEDEDDTPSVNCTPSEYQKSFLDGKTNNNNEVIVSPPVPNENAILDGGIEAASKPNEVVESDISLKPGCWKIHGGENGKSTQVTTATTKAADPATCGPHRGWNVGAIAPTAVSSPPTPQNTPSIDPEEQLREWLMGATSHEGSNLKDRRILRIPYAPLFTDTHLKYALTFAADELDILRSRSLSLRTYLQRDPYRLRSCEIPGMLDMQFLHTAFQELDSLSHEKLQETVCEAAHAIDQLVEVTAKLRGMIVGQKKMHAKRGNWSEIQDLLRLGLVDQKWVAEECKL